MSRQLWVLIVDLVADLFKDGLALFLLKKFFKGLVKNPIKESPITSFLQVPTLNTQEC